MSHYFIDDKTLKTEIKYFSYTFHGKEFQFMSDNGLFSKEHIDYASNLLINHIESLTGSLIDMGCGYGTMGIMLAGVYPISLTLADVNEKAVEFAKKNCELNHIDAQCLISNCFDNIKNCFDTIVINPPIHAGKSVVYKMYEQSFSHLKEGGSLFLVIQKKHGADSTKEKLMEVFGNCGTLYKKKGYFIFQCKKSK